MHYHGMIRELIGEAKKHLKEKRARLVSKISLKIGTEIDQSHFLKDLSLFSQGTVLENVPVKITERFPGDHIILDQIELEDGTS